MINELIFMGKRDSAVYRMQRTIQKLMNSHIKNYLHQQLISLSSHQIPNPAQNQHNPTKQSSQPTHQATS